VRPRGEGLIDREEKGPDLPLVLYGEVYLPDPLNEELSVLVAFLTVSFDDLGTLKEVIPLTNLKGCRVAARGGGGRG
jgi:hypothetical protein